MKWFLVWLSKRSCSGRLVAGEGCTFTRDDSFAAPVGFGVGLGAGFGADFEPAAAFAALGCLSVMDVVKVPRLISTCTPVHRLCRCQTRRGTNLHVFRSPETYAELVPHVCADILALEARYSLPNLD